MLGEDTDDLYLDGIGIKVMFDGRLRGLNERGNFMIIFIFLRRRVRVVL